MQVANCTNFRRLQGVNLCSLLVKNLTVSTQKHKTRLIASPMSRPKEGRPIDKRKEYLVRGVELLGTIPQKPDYKQNCGDDIKTSTGKKTPVMGIAPCHPSHNCGGNTIQQHGNYANNSNENHAVLLSHAGRLDLPRFQQNFQNLNEVIFSKRNPPPVSTIAAFVIEQYTIRIFDYLILWCAIGNNINFVPLHAG